MQTVEGHEGTEFDHLFSPYWNLLLWMREGLLLRKQWPFWLRLLVVGPLENTHMSPFSTDVVISTAGRFQRLDSAKGSIHWSSFQLLTGVLLNLTLPGPRDQLTSGRGGGGGHWHHGFEFTGTHKFFHHENMAVHNNLSWFSSFFSFGFFLTTSGSNKVPKLATY